MDRREFLKKSTLGLGALAATSLLAHPAVAEIKKLITDKQEEDMLTSSLIKVNPDKCIHCGACIRDCMQSCLEFDEQQLPRLKAQGLGCGECQHCMAVCPTAALSWGGIDPEKLEAVCLADSEQLLGLMKSRRSHFVAATSASGCGSGCWKYHTGRPSPTANWPKRLDASQRKPWAGPSDTTR